MKKLFVLMFVCIVFGIPVTKVQAAPGTAISAAQLVANSTDAGNGKPDNRAARLRAFLRSYEPGVRSPLADEAEYIVAEADTYNVDWKLVTAIAGVESTFCKFIPAASHNCWGWGIPTGSQSGIRFASYEEGITAVTKGLRENYLDKGKDSLDKIGRTYAASPAWSWKVRLFLDKIDRYEDTSIPNMDITL